MQEIEQKDSTRRIDTICFGGSDWWYHNRAHMDVQLMRRLAKRGTLLYVNSIIMASPKLKQGRKLITKVVRKAKSIFTGHQKTDEGFWVFSPFSLPLQHIDCARPLNERLIQLQVERVKRKIGITSPVIWAVCPAACNIAIRMKEGKLVYQRTDCFEEFPDVDTDKISGFDRKLKANADLTIFVNKSLYDKECGQCKNAIYLDHGVDFDRFAGAQTDDGIPDDIAQIPKPIAGYFGALDDHKLDKDFIGSVADMLPNVSFVFVGGKGADYSSLLAKGNVWMVGQKTYEQIPHYGKCFDVAIIPWRQNRWTAAANPIKLKEYLALGKPVVTTPAFTELQLYSDIVYQGTSAQDFAQGIQKALAEDSPQLAEERRKKVAHSSWDSKAETVLSQLFS